MLVQDLVEAFERNRLLTYASAVAFRVFVALIPLALLGIALLGAFGQQHVWNERGRGADRRHLARDVAPLPLVRHLDRPLPQRPGGLLAFALATTYVYSSSIIFMVGIQLDALLRSDG